MATVNYYSDGGYDPKPFTTREAAQKKLETLKQQSKDSEYYLKMHGKTCAPSKLEIIEVYGGFKVRETIG